MGKVSGGAGRAGGRNSGRRAAVGGIAAAPATVAEAVPAQAASTGLLTETRVYDNSYGSRVYLFETADGTDVGMTVSSIGAITFNVNGSYDRSGTLDQATANAISLRLMRQIRQDARTRPDGYTYFASANKNDGYGPERTIAYNAIGMSRPERAEIGNPQYGIVRNGKLTPNEDALRKEEGSSYSLYNSLWQRTKQEYQQNRVRG